MVKQIDIKTGKYCPKEDFVLYIFTTTVLKRNKFEWRLTNVYSLVRQVKVVAVSIKS